MWLKIGIGTFLIVGTAVITFFFIGLSKLMEWLYENAPEQRQKRERIK